MRGRKIKKFFLMFIFVLVIVLICCSPDSTDPLGNNGDTNGDNGENNEGTTTEETWSALYDLSSGEEEMEGLCVAADGGFVIAGNTTEFGEGDGTAWILKLSSSGQVVWAKAYDGPGDESILDIKQTKDGGYIGTDWTSSFGAVRSDFWLIKLDGSGAIQWQYTYGGSGIEQACSVDLTNDGGYVIAGGTTSFGHGEADIWLLKLDSGGNILWQKAYGGSEDDALYSFQKIVGGGYIVPGLTESVGIDDSGDLWTLKLDESGNILWQKVFGLKNYWDEALSVCAIPGRRWDSPHLAYEIHV